MSDINQISKDFFTVEVVIKEEREHFEAIKGTKPRFRVQFSFGKGSWSYRYFNSADDAASATCRKAGYGPTGRAYVRTPRSQKIQVCGPRGGWSAYYAAPPRSEAHK